MNFIRKFNVGITAICTVLLASYWYQGLQVPAWTALIWCASTFLHELENLLKGR